MERLMLNTWEMIQNFIWLNDWLYSVITIITHQKILGSYPDPLHHLIIWSQISSNHGEISNYYLKAKVSK